MQGPHVVPFASPPSLEVEVVLPHAGRVKGMGVREGVSVVVGGGFHGKSTLLNALEVGVYDKIPGDGRELVVCCHAAAKIRCVGICWMHSITKDLSQNDLCHKMIYVTK